jgi:hypothetical protein
MLQSSIGLYVLGMWVNRMGSMAEYAFAAAQNSTPVLDRAAPGRSRESVPEQARRSRHPGSAAPVETGVPVQVFGLGTVGARVQSNVLQGRGLAG